MSESTQLTYSNFVLPSVLVSRIDIARMAADAERVDSELTASAVRASSGGNAAESVVYSPQLSAFLEANKLSFDDNRLRTQVIAQLRLLKDKVPVIHMTFSAAADQASLQKIMQWLRESVHPQAVIAVGLQPALVAGVYIRTPNHVHDLSLRAKLKEQRPLIVKELEAAHGRG